MSDWRAGISKAARSPPKSASVTSQPIVRWPVSESAQSAAASSSINACAMRTTRSFSLRSATTPPGSEKRRMGKVFAADTSPTMKASFVSSSAVHPTATVCIHEPTSEVVCPSQKSRKFRYLARVRNGFSERDGGGAVIGAPKRSSGAP